MAKTSANVSAADILGGGNPTNSFSATRDRGEVMRVLSAQRNDLNKTLNNLNSTLAIVAANDRMAENSNKIVSFFNARDKRDNVLQLRKERDARKVNTLIVADVERQEKFDKAELSPYMKKTLKLEEKQVRLLEELTGGKSGLIGKILGGIGSLALGGGALAGRGVMGVGKMAAPGLNAIFGAIGEIGGMAARNPSGILQAASRFRMILGTAFGLFQAFEGWTDAEKLLNIEGREATFVEKTAAAVGGLADGFTFGLASWITNKLGGETMPQVINGLFQDFGNNVDLAVAGVQREAEMIMADPSGYLGMLPSRIYDGTTALFSIIGTGLLNGLDWLGTQIKPPEGSTLDFAITGIRRDMEMFMADAGGYLLNIFPKRIAGLIGWVGDSINSFFASMTPTAASTIDLINKGGERVSEILVAGVGVVYDFAANVIAKLFQPSEGAAGDGVEAQGQSIMGAVLANAGQIAVDVSLAIIGKLWETFTSAGFWGGVGSILWGATKVVGEGVAKLGFNIVDGIFSALQPLLTPIVVAQAMGVNIAPIAENIARLVGTTIDRTSGFFKAIASGLDTVSGIFGGLTEFLSKNIAGPTSIIESHTGQISKIFATADQAGGMFGSLIRFFDHVDTAFSLFSQGFSFLGSIGGRIVTAASVIGSVVAKFAWPLQIIFSVVDFMSGFSNAAENLGIDPAKLTLGDKLISGFGSVIGGIVDFPINALSWVVTKVAGLFGAEVDRIENLGQVFGFENTSRLLNSYFEGVGAQLGRIGGFISNIVMVPVNLFKWGVDAIANLFGFDVFEGDPAEHLNAAGSSYLNAGKNLLSFIGVIPWKIGTWIFNKISDLFGFDVQADTDFDSVITSLSNMPSIGEILGNTVTKIGDWMADLFSWENISQGIKNVVPDRVANWLGLSGPAAPAIVDQLKAGNTAVLNDSQAANINEAVNSLIAQQRELQSDLAGTYFTQSGRLADEEELRKVIAALASIDASTRNPANNNTNVANNNVPQNATMPTTIQVPNVVVVKPNKYGNILQGGNIRPFADGGIITKQIMFPLNDGSMGMAGEAGPEAIMPLERMRDNALGVKVSGLDQLGANIKEGAVNILDGVIVIGTSYGNKLEDLLKDGGEGEGAYPPSVLRTAVNNQPPRPRPATTEEIIARQIGQAPADMSGMAELGSVSKLFESGGRGVNTVSSGRGDAGGVSYGAHQLSSKTGTMAEFLRSEYAQPFADKFRGLMPGTDAFNRVYKEVATSAPDVFEKAQQQFIGATHYLPQVNKLKEMGIDVANRGKGVQELVYSMGVQHRGATDDIFQRALKGVDVNALTDNDIINRVMDERSKVGQYFKSSSEAVQQGVYNRFNGAGGEREKLLALAGEYGDKAKEFTGSAMNKGKELAGEYVPKAKEFAGNAAEKGKELLGGLTERFNAVINQPISPEEQARQAEYAEFDRQVMLTEEAKRNEVAAYMQGTPEFNDPRTTVMDAQPPMPAPVAPAPAPVQAAENTKPQQSVSPLANIPMFIDDLGMFIVSTNGVG